MKNTKKIAVILIVMVLCLATVIGCVACKNPTDKNKGEKTTFKITMWVSELEGVKEQFQSQVEAFNASNDKYIIEADINGVTESESATQMISDVDTGADIFCFAQDQLNRLVQAGALQYLGTAAADAVRAANSAGSVQAATVGDRIYCYPLTSDNGYYMYYDKSVVSEDHIDDLDLILADCNAVDKQFSFNLGSSGWYNASFFFGAGCNSSWTVSDDGKAFIGVEDDYNSDNGLIAIKGLSAFMNNPAYLDSSETADFGKNSAVVISGTWGSDAAKTALGENMGVAKLPQYRVDGVQYQLGSYFGCKLLGVKPQQDLEKSKALQALATYLTNKDCQLQRFELKGWGPSNLEAQQDPRVVADPSLIALNAQAVYSKPQGQIPGGWWDVTKTLAAAAQTANGDEAKLKEALEAYQASVNTMADPNYKPGTEATVIGGIMGDSAWIKDHEMTNNQGVWTTNYPLYLNAGEQLKIRFGKTWENGEYGDGAANYAVETSGLYWVKTNVEEKSIELVPASFGVVGKINGVDTWDTDTVMTDVDGVMTATMTLANGDEIKVRVDGAWAVNYGDGEKNIAISADGEYVITMSFDLDNMTWVVNVNNASAE